MRGLLRVLLWAGIVGGVLFLIGWAFLFETWVVLDNGMAPNLIKGDKVLVYVRSGQGVGAPLVCRHPSDPARRVVGRVVGRPGDRVKMERAILFINGTPIDTSIESDYVLVEDGDRGPPRTVKLQERIESIGMVRYRILWPAGGSALSRRFRMSEKQVRDNHFFLLADNRAHGTDSRVYGVVEISSCIGRPLLVYHPGKSSGDAGSGSRWFSIVR